MAVGYDLIAGMCQIPRNHYIDDSLILVYFPKAFVQRPERRWNAQSDEAGLVSSILMPLPHHSTSHIAAFQAVRSPGHGPSLASLEGCCRERIAIFVENILIENQIGGMKNTLC